MEPNSDTSDVDSIRHADQPVNRSLSILPLTHPSLFTLPPSLLHSSLLSFRDVLETDKPAKGISAKVLTGVMS